MAPRAKGDEADLFAKHHSRLVGSLRRMGIDPNTAEEAAQFAWLKLFEKQPERTYVFAWLLTVAKREAWAMGRRSRREEAVEQLPEHGGGDDLAERIDKADVERLLRTTMAESLTANQRVALGLWAQGIPYKEIAERTGRTYTWVNRHVSEGLAALRALMGGED